MGAWNGEEKNKVNKLTERKMKNRRERVRQAVYTSYLLVVLTPLTPFHLSSF